MTNEEAIEILNKINPFNDNSKMQEYFESVEIAINSIQENTKLKAEIEQLKEELEQSNSRIKDKIISRRWKFASDTNPIEAMCMQWANRMNDWCIETVEEVKQALKCEVSND